MLTLNKEQDEDQDNDGRIQLTNLVAEKLRTFEQSADIEVQERACSLLQLIKYILKELNAAVAAEEENGGEIGGIGVGVVSELWSLFEGELNPVAPKAQKKVPVPEGLDLDAWINDPPSDDEPTAEEIELQHQQQQQQQQRSNADFGGGGGGLGKSAGGTFAYSMSSQNYAAGMALYNSQQSASVGAKKVIFIYSKTNNLYLKLNVFSKR